MDGWVSHLILGARPKIFFFFFKKNLKFFWPLEDLFLFLFLLVSLSFGFSLSGFFLLSVIEGEKAAGGGGPELMKVVVVGLLSINPQYHNWRVAGRKRS